MNIESRIKGAFVRNEPRNLKKMLSRFTYLASVVFFFSFFLTLAPPLSFFFFISNRDTSSPWAARLSQRLFFPSFHKNNKRGRGGATYYRRVLLFNKSFSARCQPIWIWRPRFRELVTRAARWALQFSMWKVCATFMVVSYHAVKELYLGIFAAELREVACSGALGNLYCLVW